MKSLFGNRKSVVTILGIFIFVLGINVTGYALPVSQRTPQVRDAIVAAVPGVNNAAGVTPAHLAAITELDLSGLDMPALKSGDFDGLTALTNLNLFDNDLTSLPEDVFAGLSSLTTLTLERNWLTALPLGIFDDLTALTNLDLSNLNNLVFGEFTTLRVGVFDGLTALTTLNLQGNDFSTLPAGVFDGLTALTELWLNANQLTALPADVFDGLSALSILHLHNNQLSTVSAGVFEGLAALTQLLLSGNSVDPIPLNVSLEQVAEGKLKAAAPVGAPFDIVLPLTVPNGSIGGGASSITISKGTVESGTLSVTRTTGTTAAVTVNIGTLPGIPTSHRGYALVKSTTDLPLTVIPAVANNAPVFTDGTSTTRSIAENTASGEHIGTAITATDADSGDTLTYTLGGTDATAFEIDPTTGQLKTNAALDYETKNTYTVTVTVSDGNLTDSITVTINITDVNELPTSTGVCKVGDVLAPGQSCTYPGTDETFSVNNNGTGQFLFFTAGTNLNIQNTELNGVSYTLVAKKLANGSWEIEKIADTDVNELPASTGVCKVGDVLKPGQSCTYPGTDAVFSVLGDGTAQWHIPNLPAWLEWINQTAVSGSLRVSTTVNGQAYHFVAEQVGTSWEIKEIGADRSDPQPETPAEDTPDPTPNTRIAFEANVPAGYTRVTLSNTGKVWGVPTQYTFDPTYSGDSDPGTVAYMALAKLMGCSFADAEVERQSKVFIKTESLGRLNNFASETVCGKTSGTWSSPWPAARITHLRFFDETSLPNVKEAVYNTATDQIEIPGVWQQPPNNTTAEGDSSFFWTDDDTDKIQRANLDGSNVQILVRGLGVPYGIALDVVGGKMYWTDIGTDKIQRANLNGSNIEDLVTQGLRAPSYLALDVAGGKMYWTDWGTDKIQRANLDGSNIEDLVTGLIGPSGIALDVAGGKMYWTDWGTDKIQRANLDGSNVQDLVTQGLIGPGGIALDVVGGKMYWTDEDRNRIQRANLDGSNVQDLVIQGGGSDPRGIALDVVSGKMYWADKGWERIQCANLDGSNVQTLVRGLRDPSGIAINIISPVNLTTVAEDVNRDGIVNIADLVLVAGALGKTGQHAADVNGDEVVNIADLVLVAGALGNSAAAPSLHPHTLEMLTAADVKQWLSAAQQLGITDATSQRGILFLEQLLAALTPKETALLANYPNPFNPETWIPYQLSKDAELTLHIYTVNGTLVRTLALGHQPAGMYQNRSRAAYWDGKNEVGEPVASGLYFYTLTAGDFTATRKMLIRK